MTYNKAYYLQNEWFILGWEDATYSNAFLFSASEVQAALCLLYQQDQLVVINR